MRRPPLGKTRPPCRGGLDPRDRSSQAQPRLLESRVFTGPRPWPHLVELPQLALGDGRVLLLRGQQLLLLFQLAFQNHHGVAFLSGLKRPTEPHLTGGGQTRGLSPSPALKPRPTSKALAGWRRSGSLLTAHTRGGGRVGPPPQLPGPSGLRPVGAEAA